MKKTFILFALLLAGITMHAQSRAIAPDFTATDCHGNTIHLYDILDGGQYVVIDFFFLQCSPCQMAAPKVVQSYYELGCNQHDVYYIEISPIDDDAACQTWIDTYGVEYPTICTSGNGMSICQSYGVSGYPTMKLISPEHEILIDDIYPSSTQSIINEMAAYGIEKHDCAPNGVEANENQTLTVYPNPAHNFITVSGENLGTVSIYNLVGQKVNEFTTDGQPIIIPTSQYPNGVYFIKAGETVKKVMVE